MVLHACFHQVIMSIPSMFIPAKILNCFHSLMDMGAVRKRRDMISSTTPTS